MTRAEKDRRKALGIRNRICATALGMVASAVENLGKGVEAGSVRWSSALERRTFERLEQALKGAWSVVEMEVIGAKFYDEHERVMRRVQAVVDSTWVNGQWGIEDYGQYLLACLIAVDDAGRLLPIGAGRTGWRAMADHLADFVDAFISQYGQSIETVGQGAGERISDMILDGAETARRAA